MNKLAWTCEDCGELRTTEHTSNLPQYQEETCECGGVMHYSGTMKEGEKE